MATQAKEKKAKAAPKAAKKAETKAASAAPGEVERNGLERRREMTGVVVSDKMQKTIVVKIDRNVRHGMYKKYVTKSRRFKAHDEENTAKVGDLVRLVETRPMSRDKRWALQSILRKGARAPEANV